MNVSIIVFDRIVDMITPKVGTEENNHRFSWMINHEEFDRKLFLNVKGLI